jgi:deoxyribose-phosphate aldolase
VTSETRLARNPGMPLDLDWVRGVQANTSAIERRCGSLGGRRSVKKDWQAAWLLKAVTLIDLTTLSGDDTERRVHRLCAKAVSPVRADLLKVLGMADRNITTGAVCVYHEMVPEAVRALAGRPVCRPTACGWPRSAKAWQQERMRSTS